MSDEVDARQAKCRRDYRAVVKQCWQLMEKFEEKNAPKKRQKRSTNYEESTSAPSSSDKKNDRKELEETIREFLKELD